MTIKITSAQGGHLRLAVEGAMTIYEAIANKNDLLEALDGAGGLEIDLSAVDEIDTAGLQLLVMACREGRTAGKPVRLVCGSEAVSEVFDRYGLRSHFDDGAAAD
jgi:anti-anti-sigma factor